MQQIKLTEKEQLVKSPDGTLTLELDASEIGETYGEIVEVAIKHRGWNHRRPYHEVLARCSIGTLVLDGDQMTWLRSLERDVDEWLAYWTREAGR